MSGFGFFRQGIYEYDKRKVRKTRKCLDCGTTIPITGGKKRCLPCKDKALEQQIIANRKRYKAAKISTKRDTDGKRT